MHARFLAATATLALAACGGAAAVAGPADPGCEGARRLVMEVGATQELSASEAACFVLAPGEYALAGFDPRAVTAAQGGVPAEASEPRYRVADASSGGVRSLVPGTAAAGPAPVSHSHTPASVDAHSPFARTAPWREGERFAVAPLEGAGPVQARVVKVVDGRFVLAVVERDEGPAGKVLQQAIEALEFLAREGAPLLQSTFATEAPVTAAGQLLVLATAWNPDRGAGATWSSPGDGRSFIWLNLELRPGVREGFEMYDHTSYRVKVLAHELTHAWQTAWARRTLGPGAHGSGWGSEGGADLVAMDLVRSYLRIGEAANWKWQEHLQPQRSSVVYALEPAGTNGRVSRGYYDASSLLRDLQWRLVRSGLGSAAARVEVSLGAVEGWYGEECGGSGCPGLVARMRARLGPSWTPESGVLLWTLSQAADDRTSNAALANPFYHDAGNPDARYGWKAAAELRNRPGEAAEFEGSAGGSFYVRLRVDGAQGTFTAGATVPDARWMVARVR